MVTVVTVVTTATLAVAETTMVQDGATTDQGMTGQDCVTGVAAKDTLPENVRHPYQLRIGPRTTDNTTTATGTMGPRTTDRRATIMTKITNREMAVILKVALVEVAVDLAVDFVVAAVVVEVAVETMVVTETTQNHNKTTQVWSQQHLQCLQQFPQRKQQH